MSESAINPVIRGDNTVLWGANGVFTGTGAGHILSGSKQLQGEKVEIQDNNGATVAVIYFDNKNVCRFEMVVKTAAPTLARGDGMTICGVAYALIDEVEELWESKGVRKLRVSATNYENITDPA
jgi:hypothetical protein